MTRHSISQLVARSLRYALVLAIFTPLPAAFAQTRGVRVTVPFAFQNGSQSLAAGTYTITMPSDHMISLRDSSGRQHGFALTMTDQKLVAPTKSTVVFHRENGAYRLQAIWLAGNSTGIRCLSTHTHHKVREEASMPNSANTEVALNVLP